MTLVTVAACNLNQWALDFRGNRERILQSIDLAKKAGARYRLGPELEVCGYGCEDHFLELDTISHSWESLALIMQDDRTRDIIVDIGMPLIHDGVRYNCRVLFLNKEILLIRPKKYLADDGNYRESRWFTPWYDLGSSGLDSFRLPPIIEELRGQTRCPIGIGILETIDATIGFETCEELFTPNSPHIFLSLAGVDIISNGSGSHHELRKLHTRVDLLQSASRKCGGVYMYSNQRGCDGGRLYYDGSAMIIVNGTCVAQAPQFSLDDVEVITSTVDLDDVRSRRGAHMSRASQGARLRTDPLSPVFGSRAVPVDFQLAAYSYALPSSDRKFQFHRMEEEVALGPACWLWDYLRRSGANGFFLPLSGGADSAAAAAIVGIMCDLLYRKISRLLDEQGSGATAEKRRSSVATDIVDFPHGDIHIEPVESIVSSNEDEGSKQNGADENESAKDKKSATSSSKSKSSNSTTDKQKKSNEKKKVEHRFLDDTSLRPLTLESSAASILADLRRIVGDEQFSPRSAADIADKLLHTCYMGTRNSGTATHRRAAALAAEIGCFHTTAQIDLAVVAMLSVFAAVVKPFMKVASAASSKKTGTFHSTQLVCKPSGSLGIEPLPLSDETNAIRPSSSALQSVSDELVNYDESIVVSTPESASPTDSHEHDDTRYFPRFAAEGGSNAEDLALQNIQARLRMVLAYLLAQLLLWARGRRGWLLVLGSANVDESLRGYYTKYDCSSADVNPIGGISKLDLRRFLQFAATCFGYGTLLDIVNAPPSAELRPSSKAGGSGKSAKAKQGQNYQDVHLLDGNNDISTNTFRSEGDSNKGDETAGDSGEEDGEPTQHDEEEMGMTYQDLAEFGALRKVFRCGPYSMYLKLYQRRAHEKLLGLRHQSSVNPILSACSDVNEEVDHMRGRTSRHTGCSTCSIVDTASPPPLERVSPHDLSVIATECSIKTKRFFYFYSANRHKMTTLTPSYHAESYGTDDNRFDLRPFLYNTKWEEQFLAIDKHVSRIHLEASQSM